MTIQCECGAKYNYDERKLKGVPEKKVKCSRCQKMMVVVNKNFVPVDEDDVSKQAPPGFSSQDVSSLPGDGDRTVVFPGKEPAKSAAHQEPAFGEATVMSGQRVTIPQVKVTESPKYSLAIIDGLDAGKILEINKSKMIIGRTGADIEIQDTEASRQHAELEVVGDHVVLRDLNSKNGTFVNKQKIATARLENQSEFQIGTTVFVLYKVSISFS